MRLALARFICRLVGLTLSVLGLLWLGGVAGAATPIAIEPVRLVAPVGQSVTLPDSDLTLTFDRVVEDSRCPTRVTCVWSGRAVVALTAQLGDTTTAFTLSTAPVDKDIQATVGDYTMRLVALTPRPEFPGQPVPAEDYVATIEVSGGP